ncbi:prokaryotic phospholipase A2-domain-containing protein [Massariosphaeria phaeospora]|uniref:Prokaryotic phospholipase A2-domain-containing protein n=1 Tax=Massariosphaeria phaeospora TaxID=100035 RepID=A0A7C8I022_9PLEO|nr:prokaryotic phospholipase A2-domain-containing protein [Massariosphaeria phaeospora]
MKSILISMLGLVSLTVAAVTPRQETAEQATDRLLFRSSMDVFQAARNAQDPSSLDWTNDGCSSSPDNPFEFDFINSCHRHDFGYRNYKKQNRFEQGKTSIDDNFKKDMYAQCKNEGGLFEEAGLTTACKGVAKVYYKGVQEFGKKRAVDILDMEKREAA